MTLSKYQIDWLIVWLIDDWFTLMSPWTGWKTTPSCSASTTLVLSHTCYDIKGTSFFPISSEGQPIYLPSTTGKVNLEPILSKLAVF